MADLAEKMRKARESVIEVDGFKFTIRRPTDQEALGLSNVSLVDVAMRFVVGWDGVTALHLIPGGDGAPVPFDVITWREWCVDSPQFWGPISNAVLDSYRTYREKKETTAKN